MSIISAIASLFKPARDLLDELITTDEERGQINLALEQLQNNVISEMTQLEKAKIEAQSAIIIAEAQGGSWLQRNWRPLSMITFLVIMVFNWVVAPLFSVLVLPLPTWVGATFTLGIGGYIGVRSVDKNLPGYFKAKYGNGNGNT